MTRANIKKLTAAKMDEVTAFDASEIIPVSLIESIMDGEAIAFLAECPVHKLPGSLIDTSTHVQNTSEGTGYVLCPSDFVKLHTFKMAEWNTPVKVEITENNPLYQEQHYAELRGGPDKPIVVLRLETDEMSSTEEGYVLEYISVVSDHTIEKAIYIPEMLPEALPERVIDAFTWYLAASVLAVTGNEIAKAGAVVAESKYRKLFELYRR